MHSRTYLRRLAGITAALVLLTGLLTGTTLAKPPTYTGSATAVPGPVPGATTTTISHSGFVRFDVSWRNDSGANLPAVTMTSPTPSGGDLVAIVAGPALDGTPYATNPCSFNDDAEDETLSCSFGAVNAGQTITFSVVYRVPSSGTSFSVVFTFLAQGSTNSDMPPGHGGGGQSRGDDMPVAGSVNLASVTSSTAGSYIFDDVTAIQNGQALTKNGNPQSTRLDFSSSGVTGFGATISEAAAGAYSCPEGLTCFGHWNVINANEGAEFPNGFEVVFGYWSVPGSGATVRFVHLNPQLPGGYEIVDDACAYALGATVPNNMPCIESFEKVNGKYYYTLIVDDNGPMRGI